MKIAGSEDCARMHRRVFSLFSSSFLLAFVKLLKSTKEEAGSNDRIGKWFSSGLTVYVCVGYPVEGKQEPLHTTAWTSRGWEAIPLCRQTGLVLLKVEEVFLDGRGVICVCISFQYDSRSGDTFYSHLVLSGHNI